MVKDLFCLLQVAAPDHRALIRWDILYPLQYIKDKFSAVFSKTHFIWLCLCYNLNSKQNLPLGGKVLSDLIRFNGKWWQEDKWLKDFALFILKIKPFHFHLCLLLIAISHWIESVHICLSRGVCNDLELLIHQF